MKKNILIFSIIFIFSLFIFYGFITMHYATDTYNIINRGYMEYAITYSLNDGRPFMCLISLFAELVNMPIQVYIISLTLISIFISCINIMLLKCIYEKHKKTRNILEEIILTMICYTFIFNFMFLENMQFAECAVMATSILYYIMSAYIFTNKNKGYLWKSILLAVIGILFYQGTIACIPVMILMFTVIKEKNEKFEIIKNIISSGIICIICVLVNLLQIRFVGYIFNMTQTRMGSISNIVKNVNYLFKTLPYILINTSNIFPKYLFIVYIIIGIIINTAKIWNNTIENIKIIVLIILITIGATFAPFTFNGYNAARLMFTIGGLFANICIILYIKSNAFCKKTLKSILITLLLISYFIINVLNYIFIINEHKKVEKLNRQEVYQINEYIKSYENENNIKIEKIAICYDLNPTYYYSEIKNKSALCIRPLSVEWADDGSINYYTGRKLIEIPMTNEVYINYFKDKDWTELNEEQFVFIGDTMYYCIY